MSDNITYPISEIFHSIQGEGRWCGTPMSFIRLAGCTVGKPYTAAAKAELKLEPYQERCCDWQGNGFPCDTNYRSAGRFSIEQILEIIKQNHNSFPKHVCLTGGEPLMHNIKPLLSSLIGKGIYPHIETSGTISFDNVIDLDFYKSSCWIAVSPKHNYLEEMLQKADELKILVGDEFNEDSFITKFQPYLDKVFLQPINGLNLLDRSHIQKCVVLQEKYPQCGLSLQLHKIAGVR